jgi:hypothetical protein
VSDVVGRAVRRAEVAVWFGVSFFVTACVVLWVEDWWASGPAWSVWLGWLG